MQQIHYMLLETGRQPVRALLVGLLLALSLMTMVGTIAYGRAVSERIAFIGDHNLRQVVMVTSSAPDHRAQRLVQDLLARQDGVSAVGAASWAQFRTHQAPPSQVGRAYEARLINPALTDIVPIHTSAGRGLEVRDWRADGSRHRPLPVLIRSQTPGMALGDEIMLWHGGAEQIYIRVVGTFTPQQNLFLDLERPGGFHELLSQPRADIIAPDVVPQQAAAGFFVRLESDAQLHERWAHWQDEVAAAVSQQGLAGGQLGSITPLSAFVNHYTAEMIPRDRFAMILAALVMLLTVFGFGSLCIVSAWDRRSEWGVHIAVGARHGDVLRMAFAELAWLSVIPAIGMGGLVWAHASASGAEDIMSGLPQTMDYLLLDATTVAVAAGLISAVAVCSSIAPLLYLNNMTPVEMIRQEQ